MSKLLYALPQVFVYVSTAYSNCPRREVHEKFYDPPMDPYKMIELVDRVERGEVSADDLLTLTPKIINPWPNTYSYTKALSEDMVKDYGERLPIAVVRPSIGNGDQTCGKMIFWVELSCTSFSYCHALGSISGME